MHRLCPFVLVVAAWSPSASAEPSPAEPSPCPEDFGPPAVYLLTFSPGTSVNTAFGHTALLLWDPRHGSGSRVYDFGHFDPSDPAALVWGIVKNDQQYSIGRASLDQTLQIYGRLGRGIVAQELAIGRREARTLTDSLAQTLQDEPSFAYNWYRPNCTTRVGDLLDQILGGRLAPQHQAPSGTSMADQVLRHAAPVPWLWLGLRWGAGHDAERELTRWEAAFLPVTLMERIGASEIEGRPLVVSECQLLPRRSPPVPAVAPNRDGILAAVGLGGAVMLVAADRVRRRVALVLAGIFGLVVGLFGAAALLVVVMDSFVPGWGAHNLPFATPLHLGLVGAAVVASRRPSSRTPLGIAIGVVLVAVFGVLLALGRGFADRNLGILLLLVPPLLATAWVLRPKTTR